MILNFVFIVVGFVLLVKGADILIKGSSQVARKYNVSDIVIGLTIVALGTSAPELIVSVISSVKGNSGIALGNVIGSNIANLCLVLGITGIIVPISIKKGTVWKEIPFCLFAAILLAVMLFFFNDPSKHIVVLRVEALVLIACFIAYLVYMFFAAKEPPLAVAEESKKSMTTSVLMIIGGLGGLLYGGHLIVSNAVTVAKEFGISEEMIGITIVAVGTSLPEVAASITSVLKGKHDIAVGNVVGSNIFNTFLVLGSAATIKPLAVKNSLNTDAVLMSVASLFLFIFMFTGKRQKLDRWEAALFLTAYAGYIGFAVYRG